MLTPHVVECRCPEECPEAVQQLMDECLHQEPDMRPTARQILDLLLAMHP